MSDLVNYFLLVHIGQCLPKQAFIIGSFGNMFKDELVDKQNHFNMLNKMKP